MMHAGLFRNHDWSRVWTGNAGGFCLRNAVSSQHFGRDFRLLVSLIATSSCESIVISWILIFQRLSMVASLILLAWMVIAGIQRLNASQCLVFSGLELLFVRWCFAQERPSCLLAMLCQIIQEWCRSGFWFLEVCIQVCSFIFMWSCLRWIRSLLFSIRSSCLLLWAILGQSSGMILGLIGWFAADWAFAGWWLTCDVRRCRCWYNRKKSLSLL